VARAVLAEFIGVYPCNWTVQVESSPVVVKAGLKKEEAEELKKRLEAGMFPCISTLLH